MTNTLDVAAGANGDTPLSVRDHAALLLGDSAGLDGLSDEQLKRHVVVQLTGTGSDGTSAFIDGAFGALAHGSPRLASNGRRLRDESSMGRQASVLDAARGASDAARAMMVDQLNNGWRTAQAAAGSTARGRHEAPARVSDGPADVPTARAAYEQSLRDAWRSNG